MARDVVVEPGALVLPFGLDEVASGTFTLARHVPSLYHPDIPGSASLDCIPICWRGIHLAGSRCSVGRSGGPVVRRYATSSA